MRLFAWETEKKFKETNMPCMSTWYALNLTAKHWRNKWSRNTVIIYTPHPEQNHCDVLVRNGEDLKNCLLKKDAEAP